MSSSPEECSADGDGSPGTQTGWGTHSREILYNNIGAGRSCLSEGVQNHTLSTRNAYSVMAVTKNHRTLYTLYLRSRWQSTLLPLLLFSRPLFWKTQLHAPRTVSCSVQDSCDLHKRPKWFKSPLHQKGLYAKPGSQRVVPHPWRMSHLLRKVVLWNSSVSPFLRMIFPSVIVTPASYSCLTLFSHQVKLLVLKCFHKSTFGKVYMRNTRQMLNS